MAGLNVVTYAAAKAYTDQTVVGGGALKGKNCTVDSITNITGGHRVTFKWTLDNGTVQTGTMDVMDGVDGQDGQDGAPGQDGQDGLTPVITVDEITGGHRITITVGTDVETVDVMDGAKGEDGDPGPGVPAGGSQHQVLRKIDGTNYNTEWADPEGGQTIQVATLPTASSTEEGNIYQYIGNTGSGLINGYFYICEEDAENPGTYKWNAKDVQAGGSGGSSTLAGLDDTDISLPVSEGQVLRVNASGDWENQDMPTIPTTTSQLTNDSNFVVDASYVHTDNNFTNAAEDKLGDLPAIKSIGSGLNLNSATGELTATGAAITIDNVIDPTSPNPVENQVIAAALDLKANAANLGTAAALDVATTGDATTGQVVKGDDSRLTDARTPVAHQHTTSDITDFPTLGTAAAKDSTNAVTQNDSKLVESGAVYTELDKKVDKVSGKGLSTNDYDASAKAAVDALGTASTKGFTNAVTQSSTNLVESGAVYDAIANAISSVYKPAGSKTCSQLLPSLLIGANLGKVYNVTDSGTTTSDFVEGAGKPINAGDNIAIVDIGSSTYKFDILSGFVDLTNYISKSLTATGLLKDDGTVDTTSYLTSADISGKADKKVPSATGNLASLDANGNLADSGKKTSAFIEKTVSATGLLKDDGTVDTTITGNVSSNTSAITAIKDGSVIDSFSDVETALSGKENTISDLSTIRSGAQAGATAYQKPSGGIPKTDLVSAVQASLAKADGAGYWVSGQDKTINSTLTTSIQFTVPDAGYGYDPYFESADGTPVYVEGENKSGTTLTYTIRALTAAQLPCKAKLLAIPVASA